MTDDVTATSAQPDAPASQRTTVRRGTKRARYDDATIMDVLDSALVAHVGVDTPDGPIVLPMAYGHDGETMYLHGALGNALLGACDGVELCATVTLVDALVMARNPFHNSMNYRCVVVRGRGRRVDDPEEHFRALRLISDHVVATWDSSRPPSAAELRRTFVLALPLDDVSAKVRTGDPVDEPEDISGPHWAGTVAVETVFGRPAAAADLPNGIAVPTPVQRAFGDD